MCGLAGIVDFERPVDAAAVREMGRRIVHRGPDDDGDYADERAALAFRRLSILDLSPAGHQPMADPSGRFHLVFNGEVYNYRELRVELEALGHSFRSQSDTEVILAAYVEWGEACIERFNGMWAIVVWDAREQRLFCSRDRFGIKPLYYRQDGKRLAFASELKCFCAISGMRLAPNTRVVRDFLDQGWVDHDEETFFAGVLKLPPAHNLTFDRDGLRLRRYWSLERRDPPGGDPAEAVRELFIDAIRIHLRSDVPIGTCLSGGLDSSAVACTVDHLLRTEAENARPIGERQKTFTAYFDQKGFDERPFAQTVVDQIGADAHWITFAPEDFARDLDRIVEAQEEPFGSTSIVAQWYVMERAKEAGMKVMLDGQGGDEVFAGYTIYFGPRFADLLLRGRFGALGVELAAFRRMHGHGVPATASALLRPLLPQTVVRRVRSRKSGAGTLLHDDLRALEPSAAANGSVFRDRLRRNLELQLTRTQLPELLRYEDRNSMAHSIEARVPFLDVRLVELLFSLDGGELIQRGRTKDVLRRALGDLLPPAVRDRTDKVGFVTPEKTWLKGGLGELAGDVFASQSFRERGLVAAAPARARLEAHRRGELKAGFELWRALNVELWARAFVDQT